MQQSNGTSSTFKVTSLSSAKISDTSWAVALFAHNEAKNIGAAIDSIAAATAKNNALVYVLVNGCTDQTVDEVRKHAEKLKQLVLVEISIADKANAWNVFVHDLLTTPQLQTLKTCFFMDGDVTIAANTLTLLEAALLEKPQAEAAGAMPATGRDRDAWRQRMAVNGMLAGNCYALRTPFVQHVKEQQIRMPVGLIGEDFFVSWLVANNNWRADFLAHQGRRCVFHKEAQFSFRSMSTWRISDYRTYIRRKWRYTLRGIQHQMLVLFINRQGISAIPANVEELYKVAPLPSRFVRCGLDTLVRTYAVQWVRWQRNANR